LTALAAAVQELTAEVNSLKDRVRRLENKNPDEALEPVFSPSCLILVPGNNQPIYPFDFRLRPKRGDKGDLVPRLTGATVEPEVARLDCAQGTITPTRASPKEGAQLTLWAGQDQSWTVLLHVLPLTPGACNCKAVVPMPRTHQQRMASHLLPLHQHDLWVPNYPVGPQKLAPPLLQADARSVLLLMHLTESAAEAMVTVQRVEGDPVTFRFPVPRRVGQTHQFQEVLLAWEGKARDLEIKGAAVVGVGHPN
jgi:hypothetical protein